MQLLSLLPLLAATASATASAGGLRVDTTTGPVLGSYVSPTVRRFLGIPYASAERWEAPGPAAPWTKPLNASSFGPTCYNSNVTADLGGLPFLVPAPPSEDEACMSVNIWAPPPSSGPKKAVMLWIHGGAFEVGGTWDTIFNGAPLVAAQKDVLLVTFNYRLNVFGFPGFPGAANLGLLDVRAAVLWVHANIARFGGDPARITLFGESAGAAAVDSYLYAYPRTSRLAGAILESGTISISTRAFLGQVPVGSWGKLAAAVGCAATDFACMRALPPRTLLAALNTNKLSFTPQPDNLTVFTPESTDARLAAGQFARVPTLIGSNDAEIPFQPNLTALAFTCPAAANAVGHAKRAPTWLYRFFGDFNGVGAHHAAELPVVFGTYDPAAPGEGMVETSKYVQGAWAAFARDPVKGLAKLGWPRYGDGTEEGSLVGLAIGNKGGFEKLDPVQYHKLCVA